MATQLETYLRGQSGMNEVLALGMIYRSSEIMRYSEVYLNTDKKSIKPEVPRNYLDYLTDAQVKTRKSQNLNNQALFESRSAIQSILNDSQKVKGIIIGTPFLASAIEAVVADPKMQSEATIAASQLSDGGGNGKSSLTPPLHVPSGPGTLAKLPDWSSDPVNRTL